MNQRLSRFLAASIFFRAGIACAAAVQSADEVCPPAANPCIITTSVEVSSSYPLDFGLRTVRISGTGTLVGSLDLACGAFETLRDATWMTVPEDVASYDVTITARRGCSLASAIPCLSDEACTNASAGICTEGDGGIRLHGTLTSTSAAITLRAAGDVALEGELLAPGRTPAAEGGSIRVESSFGSIETAALFNVNSGFDEYYAGPGVGGDITLRAANDVTIRNQILATGGGASVEVDSGREIVVASNILAQGRQGRDAIGGTIDLSAGQDLRIVRELVRPVLNITGGTEKGTYYGVTYGGPGGYGFLSAGRNVISGEDVLLWGDSGDSTGPADTTPLSGDWYFEAGEDLTMDSTVLARAWGRYGYSLHGVSMYAGEAVRIGRRGRIATSGSHSGDVRIVSSNGGPVSIDGRVNVAGRKIKSYGQRHGDGGDVFVSGGDITVAGRIMNGGPSSAGRIDVRACRLRVKSGGKIDGAIGKQYDGGSRNYFAVGESMVTEPSGSIRAVASGSHRISYRDAAKPPVLKGLVTPAPELILAPGLAGCPVCGNSEVDQSETCDDGNVAGGDGCDSMCVLEP